MSPDTGNMLLQERINKVFQVNVMSIDQADFLATHVPFDNLAVQFDGDMNSSAQRMNEDEVFRQLVLNPESQHRMIIVRGSNGAGKSNLIRWLRVKYQKSTSMERDQLIFLKRVENSLRGLMRQLLEQDAVHDPVMRERVENSLRAAERLSEAELRLRILSELVSKIELDDNNTFTEPRRKQIVAFLNDNAVRTALRIKDGPVDRIYNHLVGPHGAAQGEAAFREDDLQRLLKVEIEGRTMSEAVEANGNRSAVAIMRKYCDEESWPAFIQYLNRHIPDVLRACSEVAQGQSEDIIRQLRVDLQRQGKRLIVLIEDITKFSGIDAELIKILSEAHGGEESDLCPVTSVIGITDSYYQTQFLGNFKNRVTHQVSIDAQTLKPGQDDTFLAEIVAKYINASYMTEAQCRQWLESGADEEVLPTATPVPPYPWPTVEINQREFSLHPFTRKSIEVIFQRLPENEKTPRQLLNAIRRQLWQFAFMPKGGFPELSHFSKEPLEMAKTDYAVALDRQGLSPNQKARARALLCAWGDGTLLEGEQDEHQTIGGLPKGFFDIVGLYDLRGINSIGPSEPSVPTQMAEPTPTTPPPPPSPPPEDKRLRDLRLWHREQQRLNYSEDFKRLINQFITEAIPWQSEGVPAYLAAKRLNQSNIYIVGQAQTTIPDDEQLLIQVERDDQEAYWAMVALVKFDSFKSWNFPDAALMQQMLINWLEKIREPLIVRVGRVEQATKDQALQWALSVEFIRLGLMGGLSLEDEGKMLHKLMTPLGDVKTRKYKDGKWSRIQTGITSKASDYEISKKLLRDMPNSLMGTVTQSSDKKLFNRVWLDQNMQIVSANDWDLSLTVPDKIIDSDLTVPAKLLKSLAQNARVAIRDELDWGLSLIRELKAHISDTNETAFKTLAKNARVFMQSVQIEYQVACPPALDGGWRKAHEAASLLASICSEIELISKSSEQYGFAKALMFFSADPCAHLFEALDFCKGLSELADYCTEFAEQKLKGIQGGQLPIKEMTQLVEDLDNVVELLQKVGDDDVA